jgi:hypothetical protein
MIDFFDSDIPRYLLIKNYKDGDMMGRITIYLDSETEKRMIKISVSALTGIIMNIIMQINIHKRRC